ncbi:hypothetical protein AAEP93_009120, partial [Penicillium crustosum]
ELGVIAFEGEEEAPYRPARRRRYRPSRPTPGRPAPYRYRPGRPIPRRLAPYRPTRYPARY